MEDLGALIRGLQQTPARARTMLRQLLVILDDAASGGNDQCRSVAVDELSAVGARLLLSCGFIETTPGMLTLPARADMEKLTEAREDIQLLLQKADNAVLSQSKAIVVPHQLVKEGNAAADALKKAASELSPMQVERYPRPQNPDGLQAAKAKNVSVRGPDDKPKDKDQPLEVPAVVRAAGAAISKSMAAKYPKISDSYRGSGAAAGRLEYGVERVLSRHPEPVMQPVLQPAVHPAAQLPGQSSVPSNRSSTNAGAGGKSVWITAPPGYGPEARLVVQLPEREFSYIERPWSHFLTRWAGIDTELERMFGDATFSLIDLGSCNGFFSLQAAAGYPRCTVLGIEGAVGVGNGTTGVDGTEAQIVETKAIQTHLKHIDKLELTNCHIAPEVWTYHRICGLAALGRPISDAMLSLSVIQHIDNVSAEQYEQEGLTRVQGSVQLVAKLLCLSPRHFIELPDRPWIEHVHDAFGSHRAFLEAAAMASGRRWKFVGPLVQSIWYGHRELWLMEEIGATSRGGALPFQGLKALFPRVLSMRPQPQPMPVAHQGFAYGQAGFGGQPQAAYDNELPRYPPFAQQPPAWQPGQMGAPMPAGAYNHSQLPLTAEELGAALLAAPTALIAAHVQLREAENAANSLLQDCRDLEEVTA